MSIGDYLVGELSLTLTFVLLDSMHLDYPLSIKSSSTTTPTFPFAWSLSTHSHIKGESQDTLLEGRPFDVDVTKNLFTQHFEHNHPRVPPKLSWFDLVPVRPNMLRSAFFPPDLQSAVSLAKCFPPSFNSQRKFILFYSTGTLLTPV
jgi:hypothetical protein